MTPFFFFLIGVLTGIFITVILNRQQISPEEEEIEIVLRQSLVHLVSERISNLMQEVGSSQSQLWSSEEAVRIRFVQSPDDKIYWIEDDVLYYTDVLETGFDMNEKTQVRMENLTEDELENLLIILNILQNG